MRVSILTPNEIARNLKKKFWRRSAVFSLLLTILVLIDEYIKEGYWFHAKDITKIGTHESVIIFLLIWSFVSFVVEKLKGDDKK